MATSELRCFLNIYSIHITFYTALNKSQIYLLGSIQQKVLSEECSIHELSTVTTVVRETYKTLPANCYNCD